ncbi:hypothetical protein ACFC06_24960 [Nocardia sp. NPDC056064]|uniref:hypothetical protein n=1 Tax=Nocardia sp. NPDC056064 TaxID=3345701 RepID=UPI0035DACB5E
MTNSKSEYPAEVASGARIALGPGDPLNDASRSPEAIKMDELDEALQFYAVAVEDDPNAFGEYMADPYADAVSFYRESATRDASCQVGLNNAQAEYDEYLQANWAVLVTDPHWGSRLPAEGERIRAQKSEPGGFASESPTLHERLLAAQEAANAPLTPPAESERRIWNPSGPSALSRMAAPWPAVARSSPTRRAAPR